MLRDKGEQGPWGGRSLYGSDRRVGGSLPRDGVEAEPQPGL